MHYVGDKIRKRRKELGLTLKEVAGNRVTVAQLSSVENGKSKPSRKLLEYIAKQLGVSVDYFVISEQEAAHLKLNEVIDSAKSMFDEGKYGEAIDKVSETKELFNNFSNADKGVYFSFIGDCLYSKGDYEQSFEYFNKALVYFLKINDYNQIADANIKIGNSLYMAKKYDMALGYYLNAQSFINHISDDSIIARIYYDLSLCYYTLDRFRLSKEYIEKCVEFIQSKNLEAKSDLLPYINMMIGLINLKLDNVKESLNKFVEAFEKYKLQEDISGMARAKNNEGICLRELGQMDRAIECFKEALNYKVISNDEGVLESVKNLIEIFTDKGDNEKVLETLNNAETIFINQSETEGLVNVYLMKMDFYILKRDFDKAEIYGFLALDNAQRKNCYELLKKVYLNLSQYYRKIGNEALTIEYMLKAKKLEKF